jgi:LDH2 family malate/lactate/ureidoglycolate dehydrogenase
LVDILCGVLSGANYGPWVPPFVAFLNPLENLPGNGIGHFLGAMRIDAFRPANDFKDNIDNWIDAFKNANRIDENQNVIIPGEPEFLLEKERLATGIPLNEKVIIDLQELANRLNLSL